jgi:hypothetical protein
LSSILAIAGLRVRELIAERIVETAIVKANSEKRAKKMEKVDPFIASIKFIEEGRGL